MTWIRGHCRAAERAPVYLRRLDAVSAVPVTPIVAVFLGCIIALLVVLASDAVVLGPYETTIVVITVPLLAGAMVLLTYLLRLRADRQIFLRAAFEACEDRVPSEAEFQELARLRETALPMNCAILSELERAYGQLVRVVVADGVAEPHELERLTRTEEALGLPAERTHAARLQGFFDIFDRVIEDDVLTEEEEASLEQIRAALDIPAHDMRRELAFARELAQARAVRQEPIAPVRTSVGLRADECAVYVTSGTRMKMAERVRDGEPPLRVFEPVRPGNLILSNQRVLFDSGTTLAIDLGHIVEVGADAETKYLRIFDDKHAEPYYFDVPHSHVALAYLERVLEQHGEGGAAQAERA